MPHPLLPDRSPLLLRWVQILLIPQGLSPGAPSAGGFADVYSGKVPLQLSLCSLGLSTWFVALSSPCGGPLWLISPASLGALGERKQLGVLRLTWRSSADLEGMDE